MQTMVQFNSYHDRVDGAGIMVQLNSYISFVLYDLILYIPVNNFSVMSGWVFLG